MSATECKKINFFDICDTASGQFPVTIVNDKLFPQLNDKYIQISIKESHIFPF